MKTSRTLVGLLAVIAVALVVIAVVLVIGVVDRDHTAEWRDARDEASEDARAFCELSGAVDAEDVPEGCVEEHAERSLDDWEEANPDLVWK